MAVLAPMPRARVRTATIVKPGLRRRSRKAWRSSRQRLVIVIPQKHKTTTRGKGLAAKGMAEEARVRSTLKKRAAQGRPLQSRECAGKAHFCSRISWELPDWLRFWQRFAREHFVAVGGQVDEARYDYGHLLHVRLLNALVYVHVGVVGAGVVVHGILDELEAGEADGVVGEMIR